MGDSRVEMFRRAGMMHSAFAAFENTCTNKHGRNAIKYFTNFATARELAALFDLIEAEKEKTMIRSWREFIKLGKMAEKADDKLMSHDQFVAAAVQGLLACSGDPDVAYSSSGYTRLAKEAYGIADALMDEREK